MLTAALVPTGIGVSAALGLDAVAVATPPTEDGGRGEAHGTPDAEHGEGGEHAEGHGEGHHGAFSISDPQFWIHWPSSEDPRTGMVWLLINFGVLAFAVEKLLLVNLRKGHAEKRQAIVDQLDKATEARKKAEAVIAEYRTKVDKLDDEVSSVLADAEARAKREFERIVEEAKGEAAKIKAAAQAQAEREAKMRVAKIEAEVVDQALEAAEKALRQQFGAAEQRKAIDDYVSEIADADLTKAS